MNTGVRIRIGVTVESRMTKEQKDKLNQHWIDKDIGNFLKNYKL